jgi:hypothetical protein
VLLHIDPVICWGDVHGRLRGGLIVARLRLYSMRARNLSGANDDEDPLLPIPSVPAFHRAYTAP